MVKVQGLLLYQQRMPNRSVMCVCVCVCVQKKNPLNENCSHLLPNPKGAVIYSRSTKGRNGPVKKGPTPSDPVTW